MEDGMINQQLSTFTESEIKRYQRHFQLKGFAHEGQEKLKNAKVLIVGVGGLGCPAAQYLTAAGVGNITLIDADTISLSNLQRQILFTTADIGQLKVDVARQRLQQLNPDIVIEAIETSLAIDNAAELIQRHDLLLDCTDNFSTRYLINDISTSLKKPWVYGSVLGFAGQLALFSPGNACFRCLFPEAEEVDNCNQAGVLGVTPGLIGILQATEAIKYLSEITDRKTSQLLLVETLAGAVKPIDIHRPGFCCVCKGEKTHQHIVAESPGSENSNANAQLSISPLKFDAFKISNNAILIDVRSVEEHQLYNIGGKSIPAEIILKGECLLSAQKEFVFYCQTGVRSLAVVSQLVSKGLTKVRSLEGGIEGLERYYEKQNSLIAE